MKTHRFLVIIEKAGRNYSAYSPDLPGCIATGRNRAAAERNMHAAIEMHLTGLKEDNEPVPASRSVAEDITVESS